METLFSMVIPNTESVLMYNIISIKKKTFEKKVGMEYQKAYKQESKDGNKGQGSSLLISTWK